MTLKEFIKELSVVPASWGFQGIYQNRLRTLDGEQCPLTFLASKLKGREHESWNWGEAADDLGIDQKTALSIVKASDGSAHTTPTQLKLRARLLKALGLQDPRRFKP